MKRVIVICPYFGKLPNYFDLWLTSASYNNDFQFVILTDDREEFSVPENVRILRMSFDELRQLFQKKFDFSISLEEPYKLCDYKPTFAYCFNELLDLSKYSFWGHFDLDVIWGDLKKFLPTNSMEEYGKINHAAHLSLYRNDKMINEAFMRSICKLNYKDILSSPVHFAFDEIGEYGINAILQSMGERIYNYENNVARIAPLKSNLVVGMGYDHENNKTTSYDYRPRVFSFNNGQLFDYSLEEEIIKKKEWAYIHLQKRRMAIKTMKDDKEFLICPHSFEKSREITPHFIRDCQERKFYPRYFSIKYGAGRRKIRRLLEIKRIKRIKTIKTK